MDDCARQCLLQNCSSIEWTSSSDSCLMNSLNLYDEPSAMRQDPNVVLLNLNKDYCVDDMMLTVEKEQIDGLNTSGGVTMGLLDTDHAFLLAMTSVPEMQINLRARSAIRALVTQGERGTTNWLTSYTLEHSEDGIVWEKVTDNNGTEIEFEGNTDAETKVINRLPTIVLTRHLRIIAVNWTGAPAFRLGIQSCEAITMRYQLNYTFPALGVYNVQMNCSNVLTENQSVSADVFVPVESKITSFEWLEVGPVTFGENATIRVRADSGNNVVIKGTLNETVLTAGFYNDTSQEGTLLLKADDYKTIGHYQLLVVMDNFVSDPVENLTELWVDYRIENLTVQTTEYSVATGSEVNVTVSVGQGSRLQIQTGVALQSYMEYFEMLTANDTITYIFNLSDVGIITIPVHVSNPVSEALRNVSFKVQRPVSNMEFSALQNIHPIYPNADATITFSVACNVDDVLLPTNASAEFDFGDNKTATETLTSFVDNTFLVSVMNSTNAWLYSHNYSTKGTYITTLNVSNDINNMFLLTEVVIEEYIIGLSIGVNSRHARVNELVSLNGTIDWGSDHVYNWNLENGIPEGMYTTNSTASSSIFHRFRMPGVYNISLTASNQVNQMTVFDSIIVQHPIQNLSISGRKFSLRPIPEGKVNATFALQVEAPLPTDAIFEVEFGDDTPPITMRYQLNYTFPALGVYNVQMNCSNVLTENQSVSADAYVPVESKITSFEWLEVGPVTFGENATIRVRADSGNNVVIKGTLNETVLTAGFYNDTSQEGTLLLKADDYKTIGHYQLLMVMDNFVSDPVENLTELWVDYRIENLTVQTTEYSVATGSEVNVTVSVGQGSRLQIQTGVALQSYMEYFEMLTANDTITYIFNLSDVGIITIPVHVSNPVSEVLRNVSFKVQRPVSNMEFSALQNIHPIYPNADATVTFSVACNVDDMLLPTNASAEFDFGDNKTATETLTSFVDNTFLVSVMNSTNAWLYSHNYSSKGTYITTFNVSNDINNMFLLTEVVIEEYIIGLSIGVNSRHARVNKLVSLNGTIDWGSDHVYNWNLENGIPEGMYTTNSTASSSIFHRFRMPGVYNISLTASNQVNQMTVFDSIIVQHPIQNLSISGRKFSLRPIPEGKVNATFALQVEAPLPTDAIFVVEFGDGTPSQPATGLLCNFSSADKCLEVSHIFTQPGDFTVTVFAWNLVSNVTAHFNHSVFDKISGLHKVLFYGNDSSGGHGDSHIYFPSHEPITFVSNQTSGTDLTYFWDFDDGSVHSTTVNEVIHVYSEPKEYAVTLNASNPMDSEVITKHIVIQRAVNMVELNETGPHATNESYKFFIWTDTMPTNASYCVFFDVPRLQWQKRCFGNVDHCSRACGDYPYSGDVSNGFTNSFRSVGKFTVNATVSNMVSTKSTSTMFIVTKGPCAIPKVDIKEPNQCLDLCDGQKRKVFYRSNPVIISSSVRLNCTSSPTANYIWGVNWYNTSIEQWQDMSRLFSNLSIAFNSTYLNRLEIPKNVLLYGIYNFTLNVSMVNEINLWQMDSVLVALNATPMSVIGGGSYTRLEYGANYTMNPLQYLRDPDNPISAEDNSLVSIDWFCEVPCRDSPGKCGCFQEGKQGDNPGKLPTPWVPKEGRDGDVINYNVVNFTMTIVSVLLYQENGTHSFWAVVKKVDPLTGFTRNSPNITMDVFLTQGDPPETTIECATNCMEKVNPFSKFSLRSVIAGFVKGVLYNYEWNMHDKLSNQSLVENLHNSWDRGEWRSKTATGLDSANLAINKDTFEGRYQEYFIISLKAYRRSSGPANFGMATYVILINEPPVAGNCTVSPNNGTSLQTKFSIKCQGFSDKDAPLSYEFGQRLSSGVVWFDQNVLPSTNKGVWLSPGRQEDDFKTSIVVRVKDHIQTHIDVDFQVKVELPDMEPTEFDNFLSGEEGIIAQSKKAKDIQAMIQISFAATSILDKNEDESGGGDSSGSPSQSRKLKEDIIEGLTSIDPAPNVQSARQFSQALGKVTNKREDCSDKIQEDSNQALSKVVDIVSDQAGDKDVDGDSLDLCAYEMFSTIGNLFDATSGIEGTNEHATTPANSGQSDDSSSNNRAKYFSEQLEQNLDKLSDAILKKKVSGETASNFTTPKLSVTLYKSFTTGLDNATFRTGGCGSFKIGSMEGIFKNGNSTPYFVQGKALFQEHNTRNWAEGSDGIKSNVLALDFKDEDGIRVVVSDRPEEIEVWIKQKGDNASVNEVHGNTSRLDDPMGVHIIPIPQYAAVFLKIRRAENGNISGNSTNATSEDPMEPLKFILYVKKGSKPTEESHDWNCTVVTSLMLDDITDECGQKDKLSLDTCFFDHHTLNISSTESLYVSLRSYGSNETGNGTSADIASEEVLDLLNSSDLFNTSVSAHYTMEVFTTTCVYFDPEADKWSASGCRVGQLSSIQATQCFCNHLTSFAATFFVPMNTFDPAKSVFSNINYLNDNPLVFTFCISAVAVYIVLVIWARKADKMDVLKTGVLPLPDNEPHHTYGYEVTVWTGHRRGAGTTAHVSFILTGDQNETDPRTFHCVHRKILKRESIDSFLMTTSKPLGKLSHLRIWHDNHGNSPSWYFSRMLVEDLQSNEKYYFICNRWLAVEEDDGMVDRIIPVAGRVELVSFDHLFWTKTRRNLYDGHIWISVVNRPPRSRFTRVQRLTCCVSLLFCTMATNIMFYGQEDKVEKPEVIRLGPVTVTLQSIYIGVVSSLIVFPINLIIVSFFRYSGPRTPKKRPSVSESNLDLQENQHDNQDAENIQELQQQANCLGNDDGEKGERPLTTTPVGSSQINVVAPLSPKYPPRSPLVQGSEKKEKKKFHFPWWVIFIAYGLSFASVGGSLYYCTEIAFTFGPEKSKDWLVSLIVGLVESVLMLQPVKVIILAMVYAIIIKKPDKDEDEDNPELKDDEEYIKVPPLSTDTTSKRRAPLPPDEGALLEARLLRFKEMKMHAVIREIVLYMVYLFLLMMCAYGNQDPVYYHLKNSCENTFVRSNYPEDLKFSMEKVVDRKSFWVWTDKILLPALYERQWYNGQIDPGKFVADRQNFLVGTARLRQVRIKPGMWIVISCD
ncbi:uncharacterized protein LOC106163484 [Lingula anatina]|uniref:Uncharacterized protein LOC106163484 n=1 Tax=Lingula anatina TaxID=7574 RepID=A0A2R2MRG8_LINAN|nr:uncharacterized protein LOC106163484 [Lingula anatina]|eukprot:XP_023932840.1 uncharacterized protein LOC106163484 [Lingula anatina]